MLIRRPRGTTQVLNKNHEDGFLPLPVRVETTRHNGQIHPAIVTAWEMTPQELMDVQQGGCIEVSLMTPQMVGIMVSVIPSDDPVIMTEFQRLKDDVDSALRRLRGYFTRTVVDANHPDLRHESDAVKAKEWGTNGVRIVNEMMERLKETG